ncbi:MAG TPA: DUF6519 domain-containing protein [Gaiellaceae bacterium]
MSSDRARVSYDPSRHWRGVINQQGRVTLEADWNEAAAIAAESERAQLVDVVGPSGTPDDGYRVDVAGAGDLTIRRGTMYVGGERMVLDADLDYADQPDWIDTAGDSMWVESGVPEGDEAVWLYLREQEVGAVEDPVLLDVALGGPDTSERLRIVQRVVRSATGETSCAGALGDLEKSWEENGFTFDPETMRLESASTLQVSFQEVATGPTLCEPFAQGGYLGAENQLIRVQVASVDRSGAPTLVWGFDNAYFMYRISDAVVDDAAGTTTLTLASAPVDSFHQPAALQAVEVLRAAAHLTQETGGADDYVAAATGVVTACATAYNPDEGTLVISTALDADTTASPLLFLRVWQDTIPGAAAGAVTLGDTGIQVTLASSSGTFHAGDYWQFAVRPATPTEVSPVYPQRILDAPQPPDGPRLWACPLAVIAWADGAGTVTDCRSHFDDLVTLSGRGGGGCCCVDVTVDDVAGGEKLQEVIDRYARQGPATICLAPGTYTLSRPLVITADHANLTIQGCSNGVTIQVEDEHPVFVLGVILLEGVTNFTLRDLELHVPLVRLRIGATAIAGLPTDRRTLAASYGKLLDCSIGVYARGGTGLRFENCTFTFGQSANRNVFGSAIFATRAVSGLEIRDCTFAAEEAATSPFNALAQGLEADPPYQVRFGYAQIPTRTADASFGTLGFTDAAPERAVASQRRSRLSVDKQAALAASQIGVPSLADAEITGNVFDGLTVPVLVLGQAGTVRIDDNTVRGCYGGFWLVTTSTTRTVAMLDRIASGAAQLREYLLSSQLASLSDPVLFLAAAVGRVLPLTPDATTLTGAVGLIQTPDVKLLQEAQGLFTRLYALPTFDAVLATGGTQVQPVVAEQPAAETERAAEKDAAPAGAIDIRKIELPPNLVGVFTQRGAADVSGLVPEADPGTSLTPRIDLNGNQIDAVIARADSGAGLLVVALDTTGASSLICANNRIRSRIPAGATVGLWSLVECAFTGNVVTNEVERVETNRSLVLRPQPLGQAAAVAVTGNVLVGPAQLPLRPNPAPFDSWNGLNTIVDYTAP